MTSSRQRCRVTAWLAAWSMTVMSATAAAAPTSPGPASFIEPAGQTSDDHQAGAPSPATSEVDQRLEAGDLSGALELARAQRETEPTAENWLREAKVLDAMADLEGAVVAYEKYLALTDSEATGAVQERVAALKDQSRGAQEHEPTSKHRDELDAARAARLAPSSAPPTTATNNAPKDRIVTKWYFWVSVAAIVAEAAAVTGIAIKAATTERADALGRSRKPVSVPGPALFRF